MNTKFAIAGLLLLSACQSPPAPSSQGNSQPQAVQTNPPPREVQVIPASPKMGFVVMERLIDAHPRLVTARTEAQALFQEIRSLQKEGEDKIKVMQEELANIADQEGLLYKEKEAQIRSSVEDYRKQANTKHQDMVKIYQDGLRAAYDEITLVTREICQERGLDMVFQILEDVNWDFERFLQEGANFFDIKDMAIQQLMVRNTVYYNPDLDLTDEVLKRLEQ